MATFDQFITSLEEEFGEQGKGKPFEQFCKWFLENDPEWSATIDKVWLWDDYPEKWQRQDLGTDLVFRDNDGLIWAVQAKCYSEHRTTTKGDLNSFLADTGRKEVDKRLWIQTTNKMEAKALKTIKGQDKPVTVFQLNDFREAQIDYPESFSDIHKAKVKDKPKPDTHQVEAIQAVREGLQTIDRGQLIMACGTGKTFTTLWIKEALGVQTTLVLLPSLSLLSQTMREWAWAKNQHFEILNVCSDKSVGARSKDAEDMLVADASFPVTSDTEEISRFLKKAGPKVLFCTYQSSELIAQVQADISVPAFDLAIADEAHRCAGKADAGFATILDGEKIRAAKRLFTTATPRYFGKAIKDEANARSIDVIGMDNEEIFGPVVHKLSFGEAIQRELLTDYQVVIVGVDEPMVKEWIDNYEIVSANSDKQHDARTLAAKIGLIKAIKGYDLERVISFHSNISRARDFSEELPEIVEMVEAEHRPSGEFLSNYVSGEMKAGDRKDKIEKLKKLEGFDRGILTNARCLAEGVDVPSLDGVAFIDPRGSQVDIIQAVGRAIRKVRGATVQKKGTIVIPVFIEDGDDPEASIEASNFKPVWDVLKALRAHDEELAVVLDACRTNMAKSASQSKEDISDKVIFDLPQSIGAEFTAALRTVLVEATTASWEFWFGLLERFKELENNCRVPFGYELDGFNLGGWVLKQRQSMGIISPERKERLDDIGFIWDPIAEDWDASMSALTSFFEREGHSNVKQKHVENGISLGTWCANQRGKRKSRLSADQILQLNQVNFPWNPLEDQWEKNLQKLLKFIDREGHASPRANHKEDGFPLGRFVANSRKNWSALPVSKQKELLELGFVVKRLESNWEEGFAKLASFQEANGHCNIRQKLTFDGFKLGQWVSVQRTQKDTISPERKQKLDDIGFIWDIRATNWEEGFRKLLQFKETYGHCYIPAKYKLDEFKLGSWVSRQRANKECMPSEWKQRLDDIGFIWDGKKADY
ncbi:Helicase associated domain protein [Paradonghicola geojensis]|nr:Helicase associated domain protein [Marivivens geojensis]